MTTRQYWASGGGKFLVGLATGAALGVCAYYGASRMLQYLERSRKTKEMPKEVNPAVRSVHEEFVAAAAASRRGIEQEARRVMARTQGMSLLSIHQDNREADSWTEEGQAKGEEAEPSSLAPVQLNGSKRKKTPEALKKEYRLKIDEAKLLEKEASQLDLQGQPAAAKRSRSRARALRCIADHLRSQAVHLAKSGGSWSAAAAYKASSPSSKSAADNAPRHLLGVTFTRAGAPWHGAWAGQHRRAKLRELVGLLQEDATGMVAPFSMSRLDIQRWLEMQNDAALDFKIAETLWETASTTVPEYPWDDIDERTHCERHIQHLKNIITSGSGEIEWVNAARDYPELLSGQMLGHNITAATTNVLAADRSAVSDGSPQRGMQLLMDIRRTIANIDIIQSQARLLLGNLRCPKPRPVLVLTDLIDEWRAMWLDGSTICQHAFASRGAAVGFMRDLLTGRREMRLAIQQTSFGKRRQIEDRLFVGSAAAFAEQVKVLSMDIQPQ